MRVKAKDATVERVPGGFVLRYERWYPHPIDRVWSALTDEDELPRWLAAGRLDLTVGGEVMLHWLNTDEDGNEAILHGAITALVPPAKAAAPALDGEAAPDEALLEYDTDLHGRMRWELRAEAAGEIDGTVLTFVNDSPASGDHLLLVLAGWHIHLDHLEDALDGVGVDWSTWTPRTRAEGSGLSWADHHQRYGARLTR